MDKRNKRNQTSDLKKSSDKSIDKSDANTQVDLREDYPDRGDAEREIQITEKNEKNRLNIVVKKLSQGDSKIKNAGEAPAEKDNGIKKYIERDEYRKRVRDKYTLKFKSSANKNMQPNLKKDDSVEPPKKRLVTGTTQTKEKLLNSLSSSSGKTDLDKKSDRNSREEKDPSKTDRYIPKSEKNTKKPEKIFERRNPMIKTIKSGSVTIYKAVTFVDQKCPPTPLQINIPSTLKKQKVSKIDPSSQKYKTTISRANTEEKPVHVRRKMDRRFKVKNRQASSTDTSCGPNRSPPTEVAKWAPTCIDRHTKPYYEAWVNTTLAAISKISKKDKVRYEKEREKILLNFQRVFDERPRSPELFYKKFADENYTGRIKITQR